MDKARPRNLEFIAGKQIRLAEIYDELRPLEEEETRLKTASA
jgi:hypothetical protein